MKNIEEKKLLSDVVIGEIVEAGKAEVDGEALNEESDEVDGDLKVVTEEEENRIDVAENCVSIKSSVDVCWKGKEMI